MYPKVISDLVKLRKNFLISATRGSHNTEYAGHDMSSFSHFFCADNHFLAGFHLIAFSFGIFSPS